MLLLAAQEKYFRFESLEVIILGWRNSTDVGRLAELGNNQGLGVVSKKYVDEVVFFRDIGQPSFNLVDILFEFLESNIELTSRLTFVDVLEKSKSLLGCVLLSSKSVVNKPGFIFLIINLSKSFNYFYLKT